MNEFDNLKFEIKEKLENFSKQFHSLTVSVSGGADSCFLLRLVCESLCAEPKILNFPLRVIHFNFNLRGEESVADEAFVRTLCDDLNVECHVISADRDFSGHTGSSGIQDWAREVRRSFYKKFADAGSLILLGHHLDDVAETVLFRLARGSSPGNLLGMAERDGYIWRPLWQLTKNQILAISKERNFLYRDDSSNKSLYYSRNVIRHNILPELDQLSAGAAKRIVACSQEARDVARYASECIMMEILPFRCDGTAFELHEWLAGKTHGVAFEGICCALKALNFTDGYRLNRQHLADIHQAIFDTHVSGKRWSKQISSATIVDVSKGKLSLRST